MLQLNGGNILLFWLIVIMSTTKELIYSSSVNSWGINIETIEMKTSRGRESAKLKLCKKVA